MLKLQFRDRRRESVWLVDKNFKIGKAADNSLVINESDILDHHIQITNNLDKLILENISSSTNVLLNNKAVANQATLQAGDHISLAGIDLELIDPKARGENGTETPTESSSGWSIFSNASWLEQNRFVISGRTIIGRDPSCDITLPLEHLSRKHVALEVRGNQLHLEDLGSSNGTFLNGRQVTQSTVNKGDKIKIDVLTFEVSGPAHDPNKTIIRTAAPSNSAKSKPSTSRLTTKVEPGSSTQATNKPKTKQNNKPKTKQNSQTKAKTGTTKKKLVSEGKQEWISGEGQTPQKDDEKSSNTVMILGAVVILSCCAAVGALLLL